MVARELVPPFALKHVGRNGVLQEGGIATHRAVVDHAPGPLRPAQAQQLRHLALPPFPFRRHCVLTAETA